MKTRRFLVCLLLVLLLSASLMPAVFAETVFVGENENLAGEYDATVFLAGSSPVSSADVKGILFAAGNSVNAGGSGEYAFIAGNMVTVSGSVSRDAFVGGNSVTFTGSCGRDLAVAGNVVDIRGTVERDLAAGGKTVVIAGSIGGNVTLAAETITVMDGAEIGGTLRYNSSANISAPAAVIEAAEVYSDAQASGGSDAGSGAGEAAPSAPAGKSSPLSGIKSKVFSFVGLLLIAYCLLWLTPLFEKLDADYEGKGFGTYAARFGIGLAVLIVLPIASIILMITGFGLRPAFVLVSVYTAVLAAAPVFLGFFLGALLWRKAVKKGQNYWAELPIGLLLWAVLTAVPYVSFAVRLVSAALALGVLAGLLGKKRRPAPAPALPEQEAIV